MNDTVALRGTRFDGSEVVKEYVVSIPDIRVFADTAVYPWLVMAANSHKSASDISIFLGRGNAARPEHWIHKRRWMVQPPGTSNYKGRPGDFDGQQARAIKIMRANTALSSRDLSRLLKENGIRRERDWVRKHRCD